MAHAPSPAGPVDADAPLPAYAAGDLLSGRYRLLSRIGEGGMATVWRAHSLTVGRDVAVKLIRRDRESPEAIARLHVEACAASAIEHPSIVRVFDFGETPFGDPFLVMELLEGESLAAMIDRSGPMREPRAVAILLPVASALQATHAKGIIHRDIKPENIFVVSVDPDEGTRLPKIVDFGLARLEGTQRRLTAEGSVLGSPGYMAPEQAMGELDVDARADVWGLCVVLYELLTGLVPFSGPNVGETIAAVIQRDPLPTVDVTGGDRELWEIIKRGLAKARKDRWQDVAALRSALTVWAMARGVTADITGSPLVPPSVHPGAAVAKSLHTPLFPGPMANGGEYQPTQQFEETLSAPIPAIERPQRALSPGPIVATPARRDNVTTTPAVTRRSPILVAVALIVVAVLTGILLRRVALAPAGAPPPPPAGAVAP